jgi:acyl-CoA synthetase (AMP-forming)/AMP-acid ligase II
LRRVLCAGAPVPAALWASAGRFLPHGKLHSPYGATEALPVATVSATDIDLTSVRGACVGRPVREIEVKIIQVTDGLIPILAEARELPCGEIGEIIVRGPVVTKAYDARPDATAAAKIAEVGEHQVTSGEHQENEAASGVAAKLVTRHSSLVTPATADTSPIWHRMGDCGYFDADGRLWFCGRKVERVETPHGTFYTEPSEQVFRMHPRVTRCALVGLGPIGTRYPAMIIEAKPKNSAECRRFARELAILGARHEHTARIQLFYFHPEFPVDVRHNAKIHRLELARWAATAKGFHIELKR